MHLLYRNLLNLCQLPVLLQYVTDVTKAGVGCNNDNSIPHFYGVLTTWDDNGTVSVDTCNQQIVF